MIEPESYERLKQEITAQHILGYMLADALNGFPVAHYPLCSRKRMQARLWLILICQLMDMLFVALSKGKLCIVDVSHIRGAQSLMLSGLMLRRIFDRNQEEFTQQEPKTIPTIAVVDGVRKYTGRHR